LVATAVPALDTQGKVYASSRKLACGRSFEVISALPALDHVGTKNIHIANPYFLPDERITGLD
jgi:hypothetical protein